MNNLLNNIGESSSSSTLKELCDWKSSPDLEKHSEFFEKLFQLIIKKAVFEGTSRETKVVDWKPPEQLQSDFNFELDDDGVTQEKLLNIFGQVISSSVKPGHPYFINQLYSSLDPYGLAAEWVIDALNPSAYTYEVAPVFTLMEMEVISMMGKFVGYDNTDGLFAPGGSIANMYSMIMARHSRFPEIKEKGVSYIGRLAAFTSEDAHFSLKKMTMTLGIGSENLFLVKVDERGRMDVQDLETKIEKAKQEGAIPFYVCAVGGSTVIGAYDPLDEIADVCSKNGLWLHVDAAWGGGVLLSQKHKWKLDGIHRADSVTWNPHKLMAVPQQCSLILTKHIGLLEEANCSKASYLFQQDKFYNTNYDTGDKHIQCGRRADVFKVWTVWKAKGTNGLEKHIDNLFRVSHWFANHLKERPGFQLVQEPQCTNVCFWYEPPSVRRAKTEANFAKLITPIAPKIKERMVKSGSMMITYQPLRNYPNFFRFVLQNSEVTEQDAQYFADQIEELGKDL